MSSNEFIELFETEFCANINSARLIGLFDKKGCSRKVRYFKHTFCTRSFYFVEVEIWKIIKPVADFLFAYVFVIYTCESITASNTDIVWRNYTYSFNANSYPFFLACKSETLMDVIWGGVAQLDVFMMDRYWYLVVLVIVVDNVIGFILREKWLNIVR